MMKIGAIIQARMGSTRLPEKVMKKIQEKTVLEHVLERVKQTTGLDEIIIATTVHERDDQIEAEALRCGVNVYRGSEDDVLSRYYEAACLYELDGVVRITSDCPLIDPKLLSEMIVFFREGYYDIVSNASADISQRTYPRGLDTEIFTFSMLEQAFHQGKKTYHREHVTPYIYERAQKIFYYKNKRNDAKYRWTLDTEEDFQLISQVYQVLYHGKHDFYLKDIIQLFEKNPELYEINKHIEQKKIK